MMVKRFAGVPKEPGGRRVGGNLVAINNIRKIQEMPAVKPKLKKTPSGKWTAHLSIGGRRFRSTKSSAEGAAAACMQKALEAVMGFWSGAEEDVRQLSDELAQTEARMSEAIQAHKSATDDLERKHLARLKGCQQNADNASAHAFTWRQRYEAQRSHGQHLEAVMAKHGIKVKTVGVYSEPAA